MWKSVVVLLAIAGVSMAALAIGNLAPKPDKFKDVTGCYIEDNDVVIPFGQATPSRKSCMEIRCSPNQLTFVTCGAVEAGPPCKVTTNPKKPYPGCCPQISCP